MPSNTNKASTFHEIEANLDIKKSIDKLLYRTFITLNPSSHEYNFMPMDRLNGDDKYQVVRELYQQKMLSVKDDIRNGHPSLVQLQAEFGGDIDSAFVADSNIDHLQFNNIRSYYFIREKITALTVHADDIIENDPSDTAKAKAWSLIAEANYLSGLLTAENLNHSALSKNEKIIQLAKTHLDQWDRAKIQFEEIIGIVSTFVNNINIHVNKDIKNKDLLDHSVSDLHDIVDSLDKDTRQFRELLDSLQGKVDFFSNSQRDKKENGDKNRDKLKLEFIELLKNPKYHPWESIDHVFDKTFEDLTVLKKKFSPHAKNPPRKTNITNWIKNTNGEDKNIFDTFIVNYKGAIPVKLAMTRHLAVNPRPENGWTLTDVVESFKKEPETHQLLRSMIPSDLESTENSTNEIDLAVCLQEWLTTDENLQRAFYGALGTSAKK